MKTLQEQYNLIQEGKGHKDVFMKSARRLFPEYVTNFATYGEATTILKQRGILSEAIGGVVTQRTFDPFKSFNNFLNEADYDVQVPKASGAYETKAVNDKLSKEVEDNMKETGYDYTDLKNTNNLNFEEMLRGYYAEMKDPKNADKTEEQLREIVAKNLAKDATYYTTNQAFGLMDIGYQTDAPGLGESEPAKGKHKSSGYGDLPKKK